ncbi:hypothetical protein T439DRAFT_159794 [Meredithblackwellia eburnea MCA 4105]
MRLPTTFKVGVASAFLAVLSLAAATTEVEVDAFTLFDPESFEQQQQLDNSTPAFLESAERLSLHKRRANSGDCPLSAIKDKKSTSCKQTCPVNQTPQWEGGCQCRSPFRLVKSGKTNVCAPKCSNGLTLNTKLTTCTCASGIYADKKLRTCLPLGPVKTVGCGFNDQGKALFYEPVKKICVISSECIKGWYGNADHLCARCDDGVTCCWGSGPGKAESCGKNGKGKQTFLNPDNTCRTTCPPAWFGQYPSAVCEKCTSDGALGCSGAGAGKAKACGKNSKGQQSYLTPSKDCTTTCPPTYFSLLPSAVCEKCTSDGALTCSGAGAGKAKTCGKNSKGKQTYLTPSLDCATTCPPTYFGHLPSATCKKCTSDGALGCSGEGAGMARSCGKNSKGKQTYLTPSKDCATTCPTTFFGHLPSAVCKKCYSDGATGCSGDGPGVARGCGKNSRGQQTYLTPSKDCAITCPVGYSAKLAPSPACIPTTATTTSTATTTTSTSSSSSSTSSSSSISSSSGSSSSSSSTSSSASPAPTADGPYCHSKSLYYQSTQAACVSNCGTGFYVNGQTFTCEKCVASNSACSGPGENNALSCNKDVDNSLFYLDPQSTSCVKICPAGYWPEDQSRRCYLCDTGTTQCIGTGPGKAVACGSASGSDYFLNKVTNTCVVKSGCPDYTFGDIATHVCDPCAIGTKTCISDKPGKAITCGEVEGIEYFLDGSSNCVTGCQDGTYPYAGTCASCGAQGVKACSGSGPGHALSCESADGVDYFLDSDTSNCITSCPTATFGDLATHTCKSCAIGTETCTTDQPGGALTCGKYQGVQYYLDSTNTCVTACPDGSYSDGASCLVCQGPGVKTCNGAGPGHDLSCQLEGGTDYFLDANTLDCVVSASCPEYTFGDLDTYTCEDCAVGTKSCTANQSGHALTCGEFEGTQYYLDSSNTCVTECGAGFFIDSGTCTPCSGDGVRTCSGNDVGEALSCEIQHGVDYFLTEGSCVATCPDYSFGDVATHTCLECATGTKECSSNQPGSALVCGEANGTPFYLDSTTSNCADSCPDGYFPQLDQCLPCNKGVLTCTGSGIAEALTCGNAEGVDYFLSASSCLTSCPSAYFANDATHTCDDCQIGAIQCSAGGPGNALACATVGGIPYYLDQSTGNCVTQCPAYSYLEAPTSTCLPCDIGTSQCSSAGPGNAIQCGMSGMTPYFLDESVGTCVVAAECPDYTFAQSGDHICSACAVGTKTCTSSSPHDALSCGPTPLGVPYFYDSATTTCVTSCNNGFYADSAFATCVPCDAGTATCTGSGSGHALTCGSDGQTPYFLDNTATCVISEDCQPYTYGNTNTHVCEACAAGTISCSSPGSGGALSCGSVGGQQYYLDPYSQNCVQNCPDNTNANANSATCDLLPILTCYPPFSLSGASESSFNPTGTSFTVTSLCGDLNDDMVAMANGNSITATKISSTAYTLSGVSGAGLWDVKVFVTTTSRYSLLDDFRLVFGSNSQTVTVKDTNGAAVVGATVTLSATGYSITTTGVTGAAGTVTFSNLPSVSLAVSVRTADNMAGAAGILTGQSLTIVVTPFGQNTLKKRSTSLGTADVDTNARPSVQIYSKTVNVDPGQTNQIAYAAYQFSTSEYPNYYQSVFNDYFSVTIRTDLGQYISYANSMNSYAASAFTMGTYGGRTAGAVPAAILSLDITGASRVEYDFAVSNVADSALDSHLSVSDYGSGQCGECPQDPTCQSICQAPSGADCTFYDSCAEAKTPCGVNGYSLGVAKLFCLKLLANTGSVSTAAKTWLTTSMACIQKSMLPELNCDSTCSTLNAFGAIAQPTCFGSLQGSCSISPTEWSTILPSIWANANAWRSFGTAWNQGAVCSSSQKTQLFANFDAAITSAGTAQKAALKDAKNYLLNIR